MKAVITNGINMSIPFKVVSLVVRTEKTDNHVTMSIADEARGDMLQIVVNDDVKKILKEVL